VLSRGEKRNLGRKECAGETLGGTGMCPGELEGKKKVGHIRAKPIIAGENRHSREAKTNLAPID